MKLKDVKEKAKICGPAQSSHLNALIVRHYEDKFFGVCNMLTRLAEKVKRADGIRRKMLIEDGVELRNLQEEAFTVLNDAEEMEGI